MTESSKQVLERITSCLLTEAERDLVKAAKLQKSKRRGELSSYPIIAQRGLTAMAAYEHLTAYLEEMTCKR